MAEKFLKVANLDLIKKMIPHRYPFLLVDKVLDLKGGQTAVGIKNVTYNEPHFQGHFPEMPIMPGVTIVEAMAQTAAILVSFSEDLMGQDLVIYFMSIDKCRFRKMVVPGDVLELHVKVKQARRNVWKFEGKGIVDGEVKTEAEFAAMWALRKEP